VPEREETLLERLIPGDLEHQIPAAVEKVLPGGFRNRLIQVALGVLITFGFSFVVRRMLEKREAKKAALAPTPRRDSLPAPISVEPPPFMPVAQAMTEPSTAPAPATAPYSSAPSGRAVPGAVSGSVGFNIGHPWVGRFFPS